VADLDPACPSIEPAKPQTPNPGSIVRLGAEQLLHMDEEERTEESVSAAQAAMHVSRSCTSRAELLSPDGQQIQSVTPRSEWAASSAAQTSIPSGSPSLGWLGQAGYSGPADLTAVGCVSEHLISPPDKGVRLGGAVAT
jgi:hypothetical protein